MLHFLFPVSFTIFAGPLARVLMEKETGDTVPSLVTQVSGLTVRERSGNIGLI